MHQLKPLVISSLYSLKFFDMMRQLKKKRVIILMYHRFSQKPQPFKIQQSIFENQIKFLKKKYNFISLKHYSEVLNGKRDDLPNNPIIITIDDGYQDNYTFAYTILKKYSIPATIFLVTDFISHKSWLWSNKLEYILKNSEFSKFEFPLNGKSVQFRVDTFKTWHTSQLALFNHCRTVTDEEKNKLLDELAKHLKVDVPEKTLGDFQALTWEQIMEMKNNGIDFGSHTCSHPILSQLTKDRLEYELNQSKEVIEKNASGEIDLLCYPNGSVNDINDTVVKKTQQAGYKCGVTTMPGFNNQVDENPFILKRISILKDGPAFLSRALTRIGLP